MATAAAAAPEGSATQEEWTDECNKLLGEVLETQQEISTLLSSHSESKKGLDNMKQQCDAELLELQEDAWKLQMLVELHKMGQQLEQLAGPPGEGGTAEDGGSTKELGAHRAVAAPQPGGDTPASGAAHKCGGAAAAAGEQQQQELADLDREIVNLDQELAAARIELQGLLQSKVSLEGEVLAAGQELEEAS